jgi:hypothetical protein
MKLLVEVELVDSETCDDCYFNPEQACANHWCKRGKAWQLISEEVMETEDEADRE